MRLEVRTAARSYHTLETELCTDETRITQAGKQPDRFIKNNKYHACSKATDWQIPKQCREKKNKTFILVPPTLFKQFWLSLFVTWKYSLSLSLSTYLNKYNLKFARGEKT